jgi:quercetin dioxygenase-like cupin family protein
MKALARFSSLALVGFVAAVTLSAGGDKKAVVWPAGEIKWVENPAMKGAWIAPLWGDPSKGAYGALKKVTAGTEFGWHTHTADQKVVAVSGVFDFQLEGQDPKELVAGSWVFLPGGTKHKTACKAGADCVFFEEQPGKSDLVPVK